MSRPASRSGQRRSWAGQRVSASDFFSSTPSHHTLIASSFSAANIAQARRTDNSVSVPRCSVLFIVGGPASGKAAMGAEIAAAYEGAVHIEVRALLRKVAQSGSALGERIKGMFSQGKPLPATLTVAVLRDAMAASAPGPFVLSDFPRTAEHVATFASEGLPARTATLMLGVSVEAAIARARGGENIFFDSAELQFSEDMLVQRLSAFNEQIAPVTKVLSEGGALHALEASGTWAELMDTARAALAEIPGFAQKEGVTMGAAAAAAY